MFPGGSFVVLPIHNIVLGIAERHRDRVADVIAVFADQLNVVPPSKRDVQHFSRVQVHDVASTCLGKARFESGRDVSDVVYV